MAAPRLDPLLRGDRPAGAASSRRWACSKIRLTGGEPLLRHELPDAGARCCARAAGADDLALTTNGMLLAPHAAALRAAGLDRVTVSLDTLRPERMLAFARSARHADMLDGIARGARARASRPSSSIPS